MLSKSQRQQNKPKTKTTTKQTIKQNNTKQQYKTEKREGEFYFTDFILHDSPKSQLTLEFSGLAYLLLNAVHLFHSVCLSGLLQLYSSSSSFHPSSGTCPQPLPSCMCTGGVVRSFTSRLSQPLSGLTATPRRQCTICRQVFFSIFSKLIYLNLFYSA